MKEKQPDGFEHMLLISPAYNLRSAGYGLHNMEMQFALVGPLGAVSWTFYTHWFLEQDRVALQAMYANPSGPWKPGHLCAPEATDISQHSREPKEWLSETQSCHLLGGDPCFCSGSSLYAANWIEGFVAGGEDWLWPRLRQLYDNWFLDGPAPDLTPVYREAPANQIGKPVLP